MAKLSVNAESFRQIERRVIWSIRRGMRIAFSDRHRLRTARVLLLIVALGLSAWLAERCFVLRDQFDHSMAGSELVRQPAHSSNTEGAVNSVLVLTASIPEVLGRFDSMARESGLRLERIDYRKEIAAVEKGDTLRINTTLIGNAGKVFALSATLLQTYPGLSLVALKLTRERAESTDGEAQITWIAFLKPANSERGER